MRLLQRLSIGPQRWEIWEVDEGEGPPDMKSTDVGYCAPDDAKIFVRTSDAPDRVDDAYTHENLHSILDVYGIGEWLAQVTGETDPKRYEALEETFIRLLTPALIQVFAAGGLFTKRTRAKTARPSKGTR